MELASDKTTEYNTLLGEKMKIQNTKKITAFVDRYNALQNLLKLKPYKLTFSTVLREYANLSDNNLFTDSERKGVKMQFRKVIQLLQKKRAEQIAKL